MGSELFSWAIFAFVLFRVGNRAYASWSNGFTNWPIIVGIAVLYAIFGAVRRLIPMPGGIELGFWVISIACIYGSTALYNHGVRAHNASQTNYPPQY